MVLWFCHISKTIWWWLGVIQKWPKICMSLIYILWPVIFPYILRIIWWINVIQYLGYRFSVTHRLTSLMSESVTYISWSNEFWGILNGWILVVSDTNLIPKVVGQWLIFHGPVILSHIEEDYLMEECHTWAIFSVMQSRIDLIIRISQSDLYFMGSLTLFCMMDFHHIWVGLAVIKF